MILEIFTVKDIKTEAYLPPFYLPTKAAAIRSFSDTANDPDHAFNKHSADYNLFYLGDYDDSTATFTQDNPPQSLGLAADFINESNTL